VASQRVYARPSSGDHFRASWSGDLTKLAGGKNAGAPTPDIYGTMAVFRWPLWLIR